MSHHQLRCEFAAQAPLRASATAAVRRVSLTWNSSAPRTMPAVWSVSRKRPRCTRYSTAAERTMRAAPFSCRQSCMDLSPQPFPKARDEWPPGTADQYQLDAAPHSANEPGEYRPRQLTPTISGQIQTLLEPSTCPPFRSSPTRAQACFLSEVVGEPQYMWSSRGHRKIGRASCRERV